MGELCRAASVSPMDPSGALTLESQCADKVNVPDTKSRHFTRTVSNGERFQIWIDNIDRNRSQTCTLSIVVQ